MKSPNIIKQEGIKNWIIFYLIALVGISLLEQLLSKLGVMFPDGMVSKVLLSVIVLHVLFEVFKSKSIVLIAKGFIGLLSFLIIYKTFIPSVLIDKILNWVWVIALTFIGVRWLRKKLKKQS